MIRFVLDTDHLSVLQWHEEPAYARLVARMESHDRDAFCTTIVSYHEQFLGWHTYLSKARSANDLNRGYARLERTLNDYLRWTILPFDESVNPVFEQLLRSRVSVKKMDLRIAAIALANNLTLLTRNIQDFICFPGLRVEDWTRP